MLFVMAWLIFFGVGQMGICGSSNAVGRASTTQVPTDQLAAAYVVLAKPIEHSPPTAQLPPLPPNMSRKALRRHISTVLVPPGSDMALSVMVGRLEKHSAATSHDRKIRERTVRVQNGTSTCAALTPGSPRPAATNTAVV